MYLGCQRQKPKDGEWETRPSLQGGGGERGGGQAQECRRDG